MEKVYIVTHWYAYEGSTVERVFANRADADDFAIRRNNELPEYCSEGFDVNTYEVN